MCSQWNCTAGYWKCQDELQCIEELYVCDGDDDCRDRSDEDPALCARWNCFAGYSKCDDGLQCLLEDKMCNGMDNCKDRSDEDPAMCNQDGYCTAEYWTCKDESQCRLGKFRF